MLGHTKKRLIKGQPEKVSNLQFIVDEKEYYFTNVPTVKIQSILSTLSQEKSYDETAASYSDEFITVDELMQPDLESIGGIEEYRSSAHMVKSARTGNEMTQVQLSESLAMDQRNLSQIENAKRPVGKKLAQKLAKVFNLNYKVFLSD